MNNDSPILEFDPDRSAILEPSGRPTTAPVPDRCVLCFFQEVIDRLVEEQQLHPIVELISEIGPNPIYTVEYSGRKIMIAHPGVGAPLAAGFLEEIIALGVEKFIVCGSCGVLEPAIAVGHPVILTSAVRDEGTSYHYLPPSREVAANPAAIEALELTLKENGLDYILGKTWTTDAVYRETRGRRDLRVKEGCCVVEMEAAALFAVAQFRGVTLGQVVYGGDLVVPEGWDSRLWNRRTSDRELLFQSSLQAAYRLEK